MNTLTLQPMHKQLFQTVNPHNSHPRLSVARVLHVRFCRWLDKATPQAIKKALTRTLCVLLIAAGVFTPENTLHALLTVSTWNSSRIPLFLGGLACLLYLRPCLRWIGRRRTKMRAGNQHSFEG